MAIFVGMLVLSGLSLWFSMPGSVDAAGVFHPPASGLGVYGTMMFLVVGFVGYSYSELMHNAMLRGSGNPEALSRISGAGIGLGQLSSALCLGGLAVIAVAVPALGDASTGYILQRGAAICGDLAAGLRDPVLRLRARWRAHWRSLARGRSASVLERRQAQRARGGDECGEVLN